MNGSISVKGRAWLRGIFLSGILLTESLPVFAVQQPIAPKVNPGVTIQQPNRTNEKIAGIAEELRAARLQLDAVVEQIRDLQRNKPQRGANDEAYNKALAEWQADVEQQNRQLKSLQLRIAKLQQELRKLQGSIQGNKLLEAQKADAAEMQRKIRQEQQKIRRFKRTAPRPVSPLKPKPVRPNLKLND